MDFNFRQYDPQIGRFLSVDPLAAAQGPDKYSPYAAMGNQPEMMIDPNGLAASPSMYVRKSSGDAYWAGINALYQDPLINGEFGSYAGYQNFLWAQRVKGDAAKTEDFFNAITANFIAKAMARRPTIVFDDLIMTNFGAGGGSSIAEDDPQNIKEGAVFGGVAGLISVGEGAEVGGVGWGMWQSMQVTGVTAASTVGVFAMTAAAVLLPTTAGAGSTQEEYGIGSYGALGQYYLGNSSYPGPWSTTYRPPFEDPINREFNNFNPDNKPNWRGPAGWIVAGVTIYEAIDEFRNHIGNLFPTTPVDNTRVVPQFRPYSPYPYSPFNPFNK